MAKQKKRNELFIVGGTVLTMNADGDVFENGVVHVVDGKIESVRSKKNFKPNGGKILDASNCIVMPGLINGHTHTGMTLLRGVADDMPLHDWLRKRIFPLEEKWGNRKFVELGTELACLEMIKGGTTTFNDMYYFEESAAKAVDLSGMRAICGQTFVEITKVEEKSEDIFKKFDEYLEQVKEYPLVIPAIAPHSIYGVSEMMWKKILDYSGKRDLLVHFHLAETEEEMQSCLKQFGKTPTSYFEDLGLWKLKVVAAHATCITQADVEILGRRNIGVVHNPESNLKLGTKICPVVDLRAAGVPISFGTDGVASNNDLDLFSEADTGAKLQVFRYGIGRLKAYDVVRMLTIEGAKALRIESMVGSLEIGKRADIIAVEMNRPHLTPMYDPYSHLIYSANAADVRHTVVDGQILMKDRRVLTLDEEAILQKSVKFGSQIRRSLENP